MKHNQFFNLSFHKYVSLGLFVYIQVDKYNCLNPDFNKYSDIYKNISEMFNI